MTGSEVMMRETGGDMTNTEKKWALNSGGGKGKWAIVGVFCIKKGIFVCQTLNVLSDFKLSTKRIDWWQQQPLDINVKSQRKKFCCRKQKSSDS
jgi:hypothetical protein